MRRLSVVLTLAAWLLATGCHWDLLQTFAWGRMIAGYAQTMPLARAIEKTFSPETMCSICHVVADAKRDTAGNPAVPSDKSPGKILLVCAPAAFLVCGSSFTPAGLVPALRAPLSAERPAPPTPPPRALV